MNKRYLGKEIVINNFLFLLSIPVAMISSYLFGSEDLYGGLGEGITGFIVANIAILLYLIYKIRNIEEYGLRFSYLIQSGVFLFCVWVVILWELHLKLFEWVVWIGLFFGFIALIALLPTLFKKVNFF